MRLVFGWIMRSTLPLDHDLRVSLKQSFWRRPGEAGALFSSLAFVIVTPSCGLQDLVLERPRRGLVPYVIDNKVYEAVSSQKRRVIRTEEDRGISFVSSTLSCHDLP